MVSFNFDDGWDSGFTNGLPVFDAENVDVTYYMTTSHLEFPGFVTPEELLSIKANGHEIGNHSVTHADLTTLSESQARAEIEDAKDTLEALGIAPTTYAHTFGATNAGINDMVQDAGYAGARGTDNGFADKNSDRYKLPAWDIAGMTFADVRDIIDAAIADGKWAILIIHQVDEEGDPESVDSAVLQQALDYLQEKQVAIVTTQEGLAQLDSIE
jgi:peptidoglycan/xylan/chitin deacetylase (PgdA/CDA1 family)